MVTVSDNQRFLRRADGRPFFWLGDTAWELFHRLSREEARSYLATRARQGFTVVQAVALAEYDGLRQPNRYGHLPLHRDDPARPNEEYFRLVDEVVDFAAQQGLVMAILPTWGDKVVRNLWGAGPVVFDPDNAFAYGAWLGRRYRQAGHVVWVLGGDRPGQHQGDDYRPLWRAMAAGLDEGQGRRGFKTFHPMGERSSSEWMHGEDWLAMNMMQSGHGSGRDHAVWEMIARDYALDPAKPVLDGEPNYEDHPVRPWPAWDPANGHYTDYDVRKQVYRSVFAGGCGVTYGHHSVWQFCGERFAGVNHTLVDWHQAMGRPGALQMQWLRRLMESRPYFARIPDQSLLARPDDRGGAHVRATRDAAGSYALVYCPVPAPVQIRLEVLQAARLAAWWYDPRRGSGRRIGECAGSGERVFAPPVDEGPDWVLVLDDASRAYPAPGGALPE
jgi:hypothetical protein